MREWEQGLLGVYQSYLRILETEIKGACGSSQFFCRSFSLLPFFSDRSELAELCLKSMCTLLTDLTHFNFRTNLMNSIVARLSRRAWDEVGSLFPSLVRSTSNSSFLESSVLCLNSLITVLKTDLTGAASLEVVRLLNRMIKEKHYNIRPEVLTCLFYLRLKTELGARASDSKADKEEKPKVRSKGRDQARRSKGKPTEKPHLSKKAAKVMKEKKEIEKEFREAEAVVDKEERAVTVRPFIHHVKRLKRKVLNLTMYLANGDVEAPVRSLFQYPQNPNTHAAPASRFGRDIQIRTYGQHRLFP